MFCGAALRRESERVLLLTAPFSCAACTFTFILLRHLEEKNSLITWQTACTLKHTHMRLSTCMCASVARHYRKPRPRCQPESGLLVSFWCKLFIVLWTVSNYELRTGTDTASNESHMCLNPFQTHSWIDSIALWAMGCCACSQHTRLRCGNVAVYILATLWQRRHWIKMQNHASHHFSHFKPGFTK